MRARVSAALVDLGDDNVKDKDVFAFVTHTRERHDLGDLPFDRFDRAVEERARGRVPRRHDLGKTSDVSGTGTVDASGANLMGSFAIGQGEAMFFAPVGEVRISGAAAPDRAAVKLAENACVFHFLRDLFALASAKTVVLLLDHVDQVTSVELLDWIHTNLILRAAHQGTSSARLLVVAAMSLEATANEVYGDLEQNHAATVVRGLSPFGREQLVELAECHGYAGAEPEILDRLARGVENGARSVLAMLNLLQAEALIAEDEARG